MHLVYDLPVDIQRIIFKKKHALELKDVLQQLDVLKQLMENYNKNCVFKPKVINFKNDTCWFCKNGVCRREYTEYCEDCLDWSSKTRGWDYPSLNSGNHKKIVFDYLRGENIEYYKYL